MVVGPEVDLPDGDAAGARFARRSDQPALIGYTSGTTGSPKGAVLSHANLLAGSESVRVAWRWTAGDRLVLALPLFHAHGLVRRAARHAAGGRVGRAAAAVRRRRVLDAAASTRREPVLRRADDVPPAGRAHRARAELAALAPVCLGLRAAARRAPPALAERGGQQVLERYGMTETLMNVSNPYDGERRPGSVGFPLPGRRAAALGGDGEIQVRGPNVFAGYWERPQATAESFADGWFRTGDLGALDPDGYLAILGRSKELIITGGLTSIRARSRTCCSPIPRSPRSRSSAPRRTNGARS